jgi:hypothetical protein
MNERITKSQVQAAEADLNAFTATPGFRRVEFVKGLLADPMTAVFERRVVQWLVTACDNLKAETRECQDKLAYLEQQLSAAPNVMPKSKALVKQAKMIARLADAVTDIVDNVDVDQSGRPEWEALLCKHADAIEAARDE